MDSLLGALRIPSVGFLYNIVQHCTYRNSELLIDGDQRPPSQRQLARFLATQRSVTANCAHAIKGRYCRSLLALNNHMTTLQGSEIFYFETPRGERSRNESQVACGGPSCCHGEVTIGGAQIYNPPGSSMIGKRHHLSVFSEDEFEEKTG
jgi:hypothetical protein